MIIQTKLYWYLIYDLEHVLSPVDSAHVQSLDFLQNALRIMKSDFWGKSFLPNLARTIQIQPKMVSFQAILEFCPWGEPLRGPPLKRKLPRTAHPSSTHNTGPPPAFRLPTWTQSHRLRVFWMRFSRARNASRSERENLWTQHNLNHLTNQYQDRMPFLNKELTKTSFFLCKASF